MTTDHDNDTQLEQLLRRHYHTELDGLPTPPDLLARVETAVHARQHNRRPGLAPFLAFALAGVSFVIILFSPPVSWSFCCIYKLHPFFTPSLASRTVRGLFVFSTAML